jgi:hypothetical protein
MAAGAGCLPRLRRQPRLLPRPDQLFRATL